jgi:uncharacterized protein
LCLLSALAAAQSPMSDVLRTAQEQNRRNLTEALEKWHEGWLDYRPTPEVRTFREMVGHILDTNYMFCAALRGVANPVEGAPIEKAALDKAGLVEATKKSFDFCAEAYKGMTDAGFGRMLRRGEREIPAARMAMLVPYHTALHYGNLITYMRLRGVVPPETERAGGGAKPAQPVMVTHYMAFLRRGPKWTPEVTEETKRIQAEHMAHIRKSADEGSLRMAGPFTGNGDIRGIFVFRTATIDEARAIAEADPAVKAGRLAVEIHPWLTEKGYIP